MSDLAPFVAATIRDKVVDDLMKEVDGLKLQLSKTQEIEVTGPNGTPVYATGMIDQGEYTADGKRWRVDLVERVRVPPSAMDLDVEVPVSVEGDELRDHADLLFLLEKTYPNMCFSFRALEFDAIKIKTVLMNLGIKNMDASVHNEDYCTCPICTNEAEAYGDEFEDSDEFESDDIDEFESDDSGEFESDNSDEFEEGEEGSAITSTICSTIPMWLEREKKRREEVKEKPRSD
eukprot:scaffold88272_cov57-Attheya_sp.AAC.2